MSGKQLLSISTSGNSIQWLDEQGAWLSLRTVFGQYLAQSFSMAGSEHLHLSKIADNMTERHVKEELYRVTEMAQQICGKLGASTPAKGPKSAIC